MTSLLLRSSRRYLWRHPWQIGLSVLGVAVAVAVVVGIDLANASANRAFRLSVEGIAGKATHEIIGGPLGVEDELYTRLRVDLGKRLSAPVVDGYVRSDLLPGRPLRLLGIDPFAEAEFRSFTRSLRPGAEGGDLNQFLLLPGAVMISKELAAELDLAIGAIFEIQHGGQTFPLIITGLLQPADEFAQRSSREVLVADVATAQETLGKLGRLSHIDLILDTEDPAAQQRLRAWLPNNTELRTKATRTGTLDQMTRAFRLNLTALSLLALLVGMFLIYNTMTFSVVQRRPLIGVLRAMGVTRREVFWLVLGEAVIVGLLGSFLGLVFGIGLARGLLGLVVQTINDLYFVLSVQGVNLTTFTLIKGLALGLGGTLLATLPPAREATHAPPRAVLQRSILESRARRALPRQALLGLLLMAAAGVWMLLPGRSLFVGFGAVFLFVVGVALLVPLSTIIALKVLRPPMAGAFGILGSLATRGVAATLSRTGVAVAALVIAVAMTIGVGIMVTSFRSTLVQWLEVTLQADVYVAPADVGSRGQTRPLEPELVRKVLATPGIAYATTYRRVEVPSRPSSSRPSSSRSSSSRPSSTQLAALDMEKAAFGVFPLVQGHPDEAWTAFLEGAVLISEPYAYHHQLSVGDSLELLTDQGPHSFPIAGVYYDYATDRGIVSMHRNTYNRHWQDSAIQSIGIFAETGTDDETLIQAFQTAAATVQTGGESQQLTITANRDIRRAALEIFDRTFVITNVLRLLALGVAFIGVLSALMALQLERARELGVLRANGLTPAQVWGLVTSQTGLMGLIAGLLAIPTGIVLAVLLIEVINRRAFGWTMQLDLSPVLLLQAVGLSLLAALLAGLYPAWRMSKSSPALALREE